MNRTGGLPGSQELQQRLSALEAHAAGLSLAQVMTRGFPGEIHYWSRGMERLYGFSAAEAVGRISHQLLRTEFPRSRDAVDQELLERAEWTGELRHRRRDGQEIIVVSHQSLHRDQADAPSLVTEVNNDITEARRGDAARQYLASIVESSDDAIIGKTLEGVVTAWNSAAESIFGYRAEEMIGQPITLLLPPDRLDEEAMILERVRRGERLRHYETIRLRKDGSEIAVSLTISPILSASGMIIGASKIVRDITAERRSQSRIQELQAELVHVARMSTLGQMASAIAHELNQPLTAVNNYASALGRVLAGADAVPDRARDIVERIRQQTSRAGEVIRRLREHVAKRGTNRRREDVNAVVGEAVELGLLGTRHQGVHATVDLDPAVEPAMLDRVQIGQVIINLVRNAVEAMEAADDPRTRGFDACAAGGGGDRGGRHRGRHSAGGGGTAVPAVRHVEGRGSRAGPVDLSRTGRGAWRAAYRVRRRHRRDPVRDPAADHDRGVALSLRGAWRRSNPHRVHARSGATAATGRRRHFSPCAAARTSAAWPVTLTLRQALAILPALSIRNVLRSIPIYLRPYIDFSTQVPYFSATACDSSDASGNVSWYFSANLSIGFILSGDTPMTSMPIWPSCGSASWNAHASLVQPGVSAFG